jgi:hypothetical protein
MTTKAFIPNNWTDYIPIIGFIFACGIFYSSQQALINKVDQLAQDEAVNNEYVLGKLDKKIKIISEHDDRIKSLEEYKAFEEGYNAAKKEFNK